MSTKIAIATCAAFPNLAEDEPRLLEELEARGVQARPEVWDDQAVDWDAYELVVVRNTWDYHERRDAFVAWAQALPRVLNPADVLVWNTDKRYLSEVPHAVPSEFLAPGDAFTPPAGEYVVKPTVSAGSRNAARYGAGDEALAAAH